MAKITDLTQGLAAPIAAENGCELWDVEYVKEAGAWFLRVYIDKDGGVTIEDCEAVSRVLSDRLDEADPIEGSYTLEVSSAGLGRVLKKPEHFKRFLNQEVEVKLYRPVEGAKEHVGHLAGYAEGDVTLKTTAGALLFQKKDVAQVCLFVRV